VFNIEGYIDYTKREYCRAIKCQVQNILDQESEGSEKYELIRSICKTSCIHSTHEFHAWLIQNGYLILRPKSN